MAILDGDAECTTGLSAAIYSYWLSDPNNGFTSPLTTAQRKLLKVQCFQWARAIAAAHNADTGGGGSNGDPPPVYTLATRPTPSAALRGTRIVISDPAYQGGADVVQTCMRNSGGTYSWVDTALAAS
jgi:hypothetical protein